jgi:predicted small secreted protein
MESRICSTQLLKASPAVRKKKRRKMMSKSIRKGTAKREKDMKKNLLLTIAGLLLTTSVMGCNMLRGAGKDVENAGGSIQRTVDRND